MVSGPTQLVQILIDTSSTNKDKKTVCMVGCLYSIGARGNKKRPKTALNGG